MYNDFADTMTEGTMTPIKPKIDSFDLNRYIFGWMCEYSIYCMSNTSLVHVACDKTFISNWFLSNEPKVIVREYAFIY